MEKVDKKWYKSLQKTIIEEIAPLAIPDSSENYEELRNKLIKKNAMKVWVRAFTHRTYDPNPGRNNETLEYLGDETMAMFLATLTTRKAPNATEEVLTDIKNSKLWKKEQARIADKLNLHKRLRIRIPITLSDREALLESTFGALYYIGEEYFESGTSAGSIMCQNMIVSLFGDVEISSDRLFYKSPLNTLKEIGDKLKWFADDRGIDEFGIPRENKDINGRTTSYTVEYRLTSSAREWLRKRDQIIKNDGILGKQTRERKGDAKLAVVLETLDNLKKYYGIDWKSADEYNRKTIRSPSLLKTMKEDEVVDLFVKQYETDEKDAHYFQLLGIKEDGGREILMTVMTDPRETRKDFKKIIVDYYEKNGKQDLDQIINIVG